MTEFQLLGLTIFFVTFILTYLLLWHIERVMWRDWFYGKRSWWNVLYKNR